MKKITFLCVMLISINLSLKAQTGVPITVTGFNEDLIANGSGQQASQSTSRGFDNDLSSANVFYVAGFNCGSGGPFGLPSNGEINSIGTSGVTYQLAAYASNNTLLLVNLNDQGTLTFQNPGSFAKLSVLASSAGTPGSPTSFNVQVNFSDGSNTVYPFTVADWCVPGIIPTYAIQNLGRVQRNSCIFDNVGVNGVSMYDCFIILNGADQAKVVTSITFTKTVANDRSGVFAVCGITAVGTPPAVVATAATSITTSGFTANWGAAATATTYKLDVSTSNDFSTLVSQYNNYDVGNVLSYPVTGLSPGTTYYYRLRGVNTNGQGPNSNVIEVQTLVTPVVPTVTTQAVTGIDLTTATGNGNITDLGVPNPTQHGVCWSTSTNPTTGNSKTEEGTASATGPFTSSITGLTAGTLYYVRAYATNTTGTSYGDEVSFTSLKMPAVTTQAVTEIDLTTATGNGNITDLGIPNPTQYGVCWSTSTNPTTGNSKTEEGTASATGAFTSDITSLISGTTYYLKAYATNIAGTSYGNEVSFVALSTPTIQASYITFPNVQNTQMSVSWTVGSGANRVVFAIQTGSGGSLTALPVDGTTYTANPVFGDGTQIGTSGWFCIYNGNGTDVTVTMLTPNSNYRFMVCEYNGSAGSEYYNTDTATNNPFEISSVPISNWAIFLGIFLIVGFMVVRYSRRLFA